jgi:hypothetical protein
MHGRPGCDLLIKGSMVHGFSSCQLLLICERSWVQASVTYHSMYASATKR